MYKPLGIIKDYWIAHHHIMRILYYPYLYIIHFIYNILQIGQAIPNSANALNLWNGFRDEFKTHADLNPPKDSILLWFSHKIPMSHRWIGS